MKEKCKQQQQQQQQKKTTKKDREEIVKGWELNDFVPHLS